MFREYFKYYKSKRLKPDFKNVINFRDSKDIEDKVSVIYLEGNCISSALPLGVQPICNWQCYALSKHPGLIVIRNAFTVQGQRYWISRCLRDFPKHPNRINLNENLFSRGVMEDWWLALQQCCDKDEAKRLKIAMRWSTMGYHHNWDTKVYSERLRTDFPEDLAKMCNFFAQVLGYETFQAQAAIVNYYSIGSTLSGHTDHSEPNQDAPLFSFSFGQTAIFLIGGLTLEMRPTALFLESGDVLVMTSESRLCYHAVPLIMKAREDSWNAHIASKPIDLIKQTVGKGMRTELDHLNSNETEFVQWSTSCLLYEQVCNEAFWLPYSNYLQDSRLNINVRQVLNEDQETLMQ
uniref:Fe2OG dioxygenase domain-containing protein n=1 Tax=Glossina brevipalpis TaxID=37001 RepID=A0A1A9W347_9MUSC